MPNPDRDHTRNQELAMSVSWGMEILNITSQQKNANQTHNEIVPQPHQNQKTESNKCW